MSQLKRYADYKDSGVPWLGEIPSHWSVKRLKNLAVIRNGSDYKHVQADEGYPVIGSGGTFAYSTKYLFKGESVLLGRKGTIDKPLYVNCAFWTVDTMYYTNIFSDAIPKYVYYCALTISFDKYATNTALPSMTQTALSNIKFAVPEYNEQKQIVSFLDKQLNHIDTLIDKQKQLTIKLAEQRSSVITHAVTNGLNPNVTMKDSGVEWLGGIPEHWETRPIRFLFEFKNNTRVPISKEQRSYIQGKYPYYGASGIIDYVESYLFDEDLILVAEDGANLLSRSTPLAFVATGKYWVNNHAHIIKPLDDRLQYWEYVLSIYDFTPRITGSAQPKLTKDNLASIKLPVPSEPEFIQILDYLDLKLAKINQHLEKSKEIIDRLKEYRSALITQAVTGKIDVRQKTMNNNLPKNSRGVA